MFKDPNFGFGETNAKDDRGMVELITENQTARAHDCWDINRVRSKSHSKRQCFLGSNEFGQSPVQLIMDSCPSYSSTVNTRTTG